MNGKIACAVGGVCLALVGCGPEVGAESAASLRPYQIYEAGLAVHGDAMESLFVSDGVDQMVIRSATGTLALEAAGLELQASALEGELEGCGPGPIAHWVSENGSSSALTNKFVGVSVPTVLVKPADVDAAFAADADPWQGFFAAWPGAQGLLQVSKPGLDATLTQAVVTLHNECGDGCGEAHALCLVKDEGGAWTVADDVLLWEAAAQ